MFEAYEDNYPRVTGFIYGYLIMAFAMWKWSFPGRRKPAEILNSQPLAMKYTPWRVSSNPGSKEANEEGFSVWYGMMVDMVMSQQRISGVLLVKYSEQVWFWVTHNHTLLRPKGVPTMNFEMTPLKLHFDENTFHSEVCRWLGVQMEVQEGEYVYDFTGMMATLLPGETPEQTAARVTGL